MTNTKLNYSVPTLTMNSDYFRCANHPRCDYTYPGPLKVLGDRTYDLKCPRCGSHLVRIK